MYETNYVKKNGYQEFDHEGTLIRIKQSKLLALVGITGNVIKTLIFLTLKMSLRDKAVINHVHSICVD